MIHHLNNRYFNKQNNSKIQNKCKEPKTNSNLKQYLIYSNNNKDKKKLIKLRNYKYKDNKVITFLVAV